MTTPILDPNFKPAIVELRKFNQDVAKSNKQHLSIAVERDNGYIYRKDFDIFAKGIDDERNNYITDRLIKSILWVAGGYKIYVAGSHDVYEYLKTTYCKGGAREFDANFMTTCYEKEFEVVECDYINMPEAKECSLTVGGNLEGRRIGFDAGGSDRKVSSVVNGETIYSEETVWFPKLTEDISYQYDGIRQAFQVAIDKMGGDVDAIGVSTAGVIIDNKPMVSSIFYKIPKKDFELQKGAYLNITKEFEEKLGHKIPVYVANDGDVTALAGALDLNDTGVLGIAMGTSEAGGYVDINGNIKGWINELAFAPVDFSKDAMVDEWSGDKGVGCKYFSQDAVIKLAPAAGITLDPNLSLADKLKYVQSLLNNGDKNAEKIFESIGVYLAYAIAYYSEFYEIKHLLILGRVTSGKGGDIILEVAKTTLKKEFPEYAKIDISMPSEKMRRVGQSIAAASLPKSI